jgi:hypothetical protein
VMDELDGCARCEEEEKPSEESSVVKNNRL